MEDEEYSDKKDDDINELLDLDDPDEDDVMEGFLDFLLNFDDEKVENDIMEEDDPEEDDDE